MMTVKRVWTKKEYRELFPTDADTVTMRLNTLVWTLEVDDIYDLDPGQDDGQVEVTLIEACQPKAGA